MSLIIKGMQLPSECSECLFSCYDVSVCAPAECIILGERSARHCRPKICPLVEIPTPHGRLIDADYLINVLRDTIDNYPDNCNDGNAVEKLVVNVCKQYIEHCPTVIKAEVSE